MKINREIERTVSVGMDYLREDASRTYDVYYQDLNKSPKYEKGGVFDTFDKAFVAAIDFAEKIATAPKMEKEEKVRILKSISIFDSLEERDVSTAELGNTITEIINAIKD